VNSPASRTPWRRWRWPCRRPAGCPVSFSRTVHAVQDKVYQVVVRVQRGGGRPPAPSNWPRHFAWRHAPTPPSTSTPRSMRCASSTRTSVSGPAPAPSCRPRRRAASPSAA
jgi:hypothetical protein